MENLIVAAIVVGAAVWVGRRFLYRRKAGGCATGCGGCAAGDRRERLVQIRR
jgi:hypothetical protein